MLGKITRGCLLALLACPVLALADPVHSMIFLPSGFDATAMNGSDRIVGNTSEDASVWFAAAAIDKHGDVAGGSIYEGARDRWKGHVFLYRDGTMVDLGTLGGWDSFANDVNDAKQILGKACRHGECQLVRLDTVSAVPEPGSHALLAAGLVLLAGWRKSGKGESLRFSQR